MTTYLPPSYYDFLLSVWQVELGRSTHLFNEWQAGENPIFMSDFHLCIPWNETVQRPYFQNRIIMFCFPIPAIIYLWEIYILPGSVCLFCCREICGMIQGIHKSLTDTLKWKLGLRPRNPRKGIHKWDCPCSVTHSLQMVILTTNRKPANIPM